VNLDWSDVTGAARYDLQVSRTNTFTTTVANPTALTASQFTTTSLPKADLFSRARAFDSAGNPGTWSAVRGFRVN
jgi:trimeric autotransporter adhesin